MKTLNVMLSNLGGRVVPIGYEGENLYTRIRINCIEVFSEYPDATVSMVVSPPVGEMYPAVVEKSGVMVVWDITDSVLSSNGSGECQLTFTEGDVVRKSVVFGISINRSLIASGEAPEPVQEWIDRAEQTAQEIAENAAMLAKQDIVESYGEIAPAIIETASGEIASFSDGADGMLVKTLEVQIDPMQDLHGYDSPWPAGGGKNLMLLSSSAKSGTVDGVTYSFDPNTEKITLSGTNNNSSPHVLKSFIRTSDGLVVPDFQVGETYTLLINLPSTMYCQFTYKDSSNVVHPMGYKFGTGSLSSVTFAIPNDFITFEEFQIYVAGTATSLSGEIFFELVSGSTAPTAWSPYKNECPISGWTEAEVTRTGKNLVDIELTSGLAQTTETFVQKLSGSIAFSVHSNNAVVDASVMAGNYNWIASATFEDGSKLNIYLPDYTGQYGAGLKMPGVYTVSADNPIVSITYRGYGITSGSYDLCVAIGDDATFAPYSGSTAEYEFPQSAGTVYGGTLTIHQDGSGELVVENGKVDLGTLTWSKVNNYFVVAGNDLPANFGFQSYGFSKVGNLKCSDYKTVAWSTWVTNDYCISLNETYFGIKDTSKSALTATEFKTAMSGVQLVYELATPVTYQLTNQQVIALLKGSNNIWADTGDVALEYPADTKLYIDGKVAELQALILENISNS